MSFQTPIAMFLFNRPVQTARVFERIAQVRPRTLFLIADGPPTDGEQQLCQAAREAVSRITWACEVRRNFSDRNLGCRKRMSGGIDWVFEQVEEAILLEDDCLPEPSFFPFCAELLERYRLDERVLMISGDNFQRGIRRTAYSYYFSLIPHIWGWATWRRAWRNYDETMSRWPELRESRWLETTLANPAAAASYRRCLDDTFAGTIDTWDYQWALASWAQGALSILPQVNLVTNLGFGPDATHTKSPASPEAAMPLERMAFPLRHPPIVSRCIEADDFTFDASLCPGRSTVAA